MKPLILAVIAVFLLIGVGVAAYTTPLLTYLTPHPGNSTKPPNTFPLAGEVNVRYSMYLMNFTQCLKTSWGEVAGIRELVVVNMTIQNKGPGSFPMYPPDWKLGVGSVEYQDEAFGLFACHTIFGFRPVNYSDISSLPKDGGKSFAFGYLIPNNLSVAQLTLRYSCYHNVSFSCGMHSYTANIVQVAGKLPSLIGQVVLRVAYNGAWQGQYQNGINAVLTAWSGTGNQTIILSRPSDAYRWEINAYMSRNDNVNMLLALSIETIDGTVLMLRTDYSSTNVYFSSLCFDEVSTWFSC